MMEKHADLRRHMMDICGLAPTLGDKDKAAIARIKNDQNLENGDKKAKIKALLNERMKESSLAISTCRKNKKDELRPYLEQRVDLKSACLISFKPDEELAGHPTKKARAWQRVKTLSNEERITLNRQLESRTCVDAISSPAA
jgi:hypothetical protein